MAIIYKLSSHQVSFYWDKDSALWTAKSEDLNIKNIKAKSFNSMLKMLRNQYPEFSTSIRIFFPDSLKAAA